MWIINENARRLKLYELTWNGRTGWLLGLDKAILRLAICFIKGDSVADGQIPAELLQDML